MIHIKDLNRKFYGEGVYFLIKEKEGMRVFGSRWVAVNSCFITDDGCLILSKKNESFLDDWLPDYLNVLKNKKLCSFRLLYNEIFFIIAVKILDFEFGDKNFLFGGTKGWPEKLNFTRKKFKIVRLQNEDSPKKYGFIFPNNMITTSLFTESEIFGAILRSYYGFNEEE